jgi:hypothetical protein
MLTGYPRVSISEQETAAQVTALKAAGCERIYRKKSSGGDRHELHRLLDQFRKGDAPASKNQIFLFLLLPTSPLVVGHAANAAAIVR